MISFSKWYIENLWIGNFNMSFLLK